MAKAQGIAKGKGGGGFTSAILKGLSFLQAPMRAVVASGELAGEAITHKNINKGWWQNVMDPSYGTGKVIQGLDPHMNIWAKRGLGLAGDIVADPLTYIAPGASEALKELGKGAGLASLGMEAADYASRMSKAAEIAGDAGKAAEFADRAGEMENLATKAGKGANRLSNEELDKFAEATQVMSDDATYTRYAGPRLEEGDLRYGVRFHVPKSSTLDAFLPMTGTAHLAGETIGKGSEVLRDATLGRWLGKKIGGNLNEARRAIRSGAIDRVKAGTAVYGAVKFGDTRGTMALRNMAEEWNGILTDARKAGLRKAGKDLYQALGERPITLADGTVSEAGDVFKALASNPDAASILDRMGKFFDSLPERTAQWSSQDQAKVQQWLANAAEGGRRAYVPRILTEDAADLLDKSSGMGRKDIGQRAGFEKAGYKAGDTIGEGEHATTLVQPGEQMANGAAAPSLEQQIEDWSKTAYPNGPPKLFMDDIFDATDRYMQGVSSQVRNYATQDYLANRGVSKGLVTTIDTAGGETKIKAYAGDVARKLNRATARVDKETGKLSQVNADLAEAEEAARGGQRRATASVRRLRAQQERAREAVRMAEDEAKQAEAHVGQTAAEHGAKQHAYDTAQSALDDAQAHVEQLQQTYEQAQREGWNSLGQIGQQLQQATAEANRLRTSGPRVQELFERSANAHAVADELEKASNKNKNFDQLGFGDFIQHMKNKHFPELGDKDAVPQIAQMLRGQGNNDLAELAQLAPQGQLPTTLDAPTLRAESKQLTATMRDAGAKLKADPTDDLARQNYMDASVGVAHRRNLLTLRKMNGGHLTAAELDEGEAAAIGQAVDAQVKLTATGATAQERAASVLDLQHEQWAARNADVPGAGTATWYQRGQTAVNADGQLALADQVEQINPKYMEDMFAPERQPGATSAWIEGDPQKVQSLIASTPANRQIVYGSGGPAIHQLVTDASRRLEQESPELVDRFIDEAYSGGRARLGDTVELARDIQAKAMGEGRIVAFDDALQVAGEHTMGLGEDASTFNYANVSDALDALNPDPYAYKPYAARVAGEMFGPNTDPVWSGRAADIVREDLQREGDLIVLHDTSGSVRVMPTTAFTMMQGADINPDLGGLLNAVGEAKSAYTGKLVNQDAFADLNREIGAGTDAVKDLAHTYEARADDLDRVNAKFDSAERAHADAVAKLKNTQEELAFKEEKLGKAKALLGQRAQRQTEDLARVDTLMAKREETLARLGKFTGDEDALTAEKARVIDALKDALQPGNVPFGFGKQAPSDVVDMLKDITRSFDPIGGDGLGGFVRTYDQAYHWMKGWMTTSPGFHFRNAFGGMFNNWLADVNVARAGREWGRALRSGGEGSFADKAAYTIADRMGLLQSGQFATDVGLIGGEHASLNPFAGMFGGSKSFGLVHASKRFGENFMEPWLRGQLMWDRLDKGIAEGRWASIGVHSWDDIADEATSKAFADAVSSSTFADTVTNEIHKYHFDYNDLSGFERNVVRRVIPFYTFTRQNLPLQLEEILQQPGKVNRYFALTRNLQLGVPDQSVVPSYFGAQGFVHTPFHSKGQDIYGNIDLPFRDLLKLGDPGGLGLGMVNPMFKAPLEVWAGKQYQTDVPVTSDYKPVSGSWKPLMPIMQAMAKIPFMPIHAPVKDKDGNWAMRDSDQYLIGQYLPFLYQARRVLPFWDPQSSGAGGTTKNSKYKDRQMTTYLSYLFGVNARTNTPADQQNELYRRSDQLTAIVNDMKAKGQIQGAAAKRPKHPARGSNGSTTDLAQMLSTGIQGP